MPHRSTRHRLWIAAVTLLAGGSANTALADPADRWDLSIGAGAVSMPEYPGSDEQKTRLLPVVTAKYGRFLIGGETQGLGMNLIEEENWRAGLFASFDLSEIREESDDRERLHGLGDVDGTARVGAFASYTWGWLTASGRIGTDVGGNELGTIATLGLSARWNPTSRLTLTAGPQLTWASEEYMQTVFGISPAQAQRSGLPRYQAGGGVSSVGLRLGAHYRIGEHWGVGITATTARLQGDAKDSPIVRDKTQNSIGAFATYHF
ncbi:MipA/OmpV family protein [Dokdonella ginsengisoli]|uniref:MipA/OmpV family protein n=1 Tax=Dokdonella ginsengisoli TaxID=363846 RepID=A0ABV9QNX8_9GAMM